MVASSRSETTVQNPDPAGAPPLARIDNWPIHVGSLDAAVDLIAARAEARIATTVFTLNLDHLVKLRRDAAFRDAYGQASVITPDGAPIVWLANRQGANVERTTGADIVLPLAARANERGLSLYLFGTTPAVLAAAAQRLAEATAHPTTGQLLSIAGTMSPGTGFDPNGPEAAAALEKIAQSKAHICFVALGAPKQELFAARAQSLGMTTTFVCIGAALDFIAGHQTRAPRLIADNGFEWLWRLGTNPARLSRRYAECALLLADLTVVRPLRQRMTGAPPVSRV